MAVSKTMRVSDQTDYKLAQPPTRSAVSRTIQGSQRPKPRGLNFPNMKNVRVTGWLQELDFFSELGVVPDNGRSSPILEWYWTMPVADFIEVNRLYREWRQLSNRIPRDLQHSFLG